MTVALVAVGAGKPFVGSGGSAGSAARSNADALPITVAFRERVPVLKAILESDATVPPSAPTTTARLPRLVRPFSGARPLRIMVVGDSVGVSFARGLALWAHSHDAEVLDEARLWCPLGRSLPIVQGFDAQVPGIGCSDWGSRWAGAVRAFDPDVVIVLFTIWEAAPRQLPGRDDWLAPGAPPLDAWQLSEYQTAADVLSARGAPVVWFTAPCDRTPIVPGSPLWYVNRRTIPELATSRPAVHVVDLDHELCAHGPTPAFGGVPRARPHWNHFTRQGALAVSDWVMPIVLGRKPNPKPSGETDPATSHSNSRLMLSRL